MRDGFKPVVVGGVLAKEVADIPDGHPESRVPKHQKALLEMCDAMKEEVALGEVTGLIAIIVYKDGTQSENAITECNNYELMGRIRSMAMNINNQTLSREEASELDLDEEDF